MRPSSPDRPLVTPADLAQCRQMIRDGDSMRYEFGTPEWTAAYTKQVNLLLDQLALSNARVIWVAPPPMRDPDYDAAMKTIAGTARQMGITVSE